MRWLTVHPGPHFSVHDLYTGWVEALRGLGEDVYTYNLGDRLSFYDAALIETGTVEDGHPGVRKAFTREQAIENAAGGLVGAVYKTWPDVILLVSAFFTPEYLLDMMRGRGHKIVLLHSESPYQDDEQLLRAAHADVNLLNDPVNMKLYEALGVPAAYMPHAYRPSVHHPGPSRPEMACDLAFIGTGYPSRIEFLERMDLTGLDVLLAGFWELLDAGSPLRKHLAHDANECLDNEQAAQVYRSAACGLNLYRREANGGYEGQGWAMGPREVEMAATGLFYLRDSRGEGDEVLPMLPTFTSPEHAGELLRWYLAHPGERQRRAAAAREAVAGRTFEANARALMRLLEKG